MRDILLCPKTGEALSNSKIKYPDFCGIPWLYRDPGGAMGHWIKKIRDVFEYSQQQIDSLEMSLADSQLLPSTRTRLQNLLKGHTQHIQHLQDLFASLEASTEKDEVSALERVPKQQAALAYHSTLFRDWVWGKKQIEAYAHLIRPFFKSEKKIAFLGAGACGLPLLIHNDLKPDLSLALDINPFLLVAAQRLCQGQNLKLTEFPGVPTESKYVAIEHEIKGMKPAPGFEFLFCDGQNLPVKDKALDSVVTSWFIDIVPRDFRDLARLMNVVLTDGGSWVNIGQLGFERLNQAQIYRPDEIKEALIEAGFEVEAWQNHRVDYLQSPYDAMGRSDNIWVFKARKIKHSKRPSVHEYWPTWLTDTSKPIPLTDELRSFRVRTAIYGFVVDQVDGERSIQEVAKILAQEFNMNVQDAQQSVYSFFANYFEGMIFREF